MAAGPLRDAKELEHLVQTPDIKFDDPSFIITTVNSMLYTKKPSKDQLCKALMLVRAASRAMPLTVISSEHGLLATAIHATTHDDGLVRACAAGCLHALSSTLHGRQHMQTHSAACGAALLCRLIKAGLVAAADSLELHHLLLALANLVREPPCAAEVLQTDVVVLGVSVLRSSLCLVLTRLQLQQLQQNRSEGELALPLMPQACSATMTLLLNLASHAAARQRMIQAGMVPMLELILRLADKQVAAERASIVQRLPQAQQQRYLHLLPSSHRLHHLHSHITEASHHPHNPSQSQPFPPSGILSAPPPIPGLRKASPPSSRGGMLTSREHGAPSPRSRMGSRQEGRKSMRPATADVEVALFPPDDPLLARAKLLAGSLGVFEVLDTVAASRRLQQQRAEALLPSKSQQLQQRSSVHDLTSKAAQGRASRGRRSTSPPAAQTSPRAPNGRHAAASPQRAPGARAPSPGRADQAGSPGRSVAASRPVSNALHAAPAASGPPLPTPPLSPAAPGSAPGPAGPGLAGASRGGLSQAGGVPGLPLALTPVRDTRTPGGASSRSERLPVVLLPSLQAGRGAPSAASAGKAALVADGLVRLASAEWSAAAATAAASLSCHPSFDMREVLAAVGAVWTPLDDADATGMDERRRHKKHKKHKKHTKPHRRGHDESGSASPGAADVDAPTPMSDSDNAPRIHKRRHRHRHRHRLPEDAPASIEPATQSTALFPPRSLTDSRMSHDSGLSMASGSAQAARVFKV